MALNGDKKTIVAVVLLMCIAKVAANPCAGKTNVFVNDYSGCNRYFSCLNQIGYSKTCGKGLYFDEKLQICDYEANVVCERCPATGTSAYRRDGSCIGYTLCINGNPIDRECASGLWFDTVNLNCAVKAGITCAENNSCPAAGMHDRPNVIECKKFDICIDGKVVSTQTCGTGTFFNVNTNACVEATACPVLKD